MTVNVGPKLRILHYLLSVSEDETVAHCLDVDAVATGSTPEEAVKILSVLVKAHVEHSINTQTLGNLTPAPAAYWDKYAKATFGGMSPLEISIRGTEVLPSPPSHLNVLSATLQPA